MDSGNEKTFSDLPGELIDYVFDYVPPCDLTSACLVSTHLHPYAVRALYRDLSITSPTRMLQCCETLSKNPSTASMVRTICIELMQHDECHPASFYEIVEAALLAVPGVTAIELESTAPEFVHILSKCSWPRLRKFHSYLPVLPDLMQFLERHPALRSVFLSKDCDEESLSTILLPNLTRFIGPSELVPLIVPHSKTRTVILASTPSKDDLEMALIALRRMRIRSFTIITIDWDMDFLNLVSRHLPHVTYLRIQNKSINSTSREVFLLTIGPFLKHFDKLEVFIISEGRDKDKASMQLLDAESIFAVKLWFSCPTLKKCTGISGIEWFRLSMFIWMPDRGHPKGRIWMRRILETGMHPVMAQQLGDEMASFFIDCLRTTVQSKPNWHDILYSDRDDTETHGDTNEEGDEDELNDEDEDNDGDDDEVVADTEEFDDQH